jgi:hypothetical protein
MAVFRHRAECKPAINSTRADDTHASAQILGLSLHFFQARVQGSALPVEYQIDHEARFVTITGRGVVVLKDILDCMDAVVAQDAMGYRRGWASVGL